MKRLDSLLVGVWRKNVVHKVWGHRAEKSGLKCIFDVTRAGGSGGDEVRGMRREKGPGKKLRGKEREVGVNRQNQSLCMKMARAGHLHAASGGSEGTILNNLELGYG